MPPDQKDAGESRTGVAAPEPPSSEPLKTATAAVGLLAGVVAAVYVLGGLVIALRLRFDGFELGSVVTIVGQLPRELVVATALLNVGLPAATLGALAAVVAALVAVGPGKLADAPTRLGTIVILCIFTAVLVAPAIAEAHSTDGFSPTLLLSIPAFAFACFVTCACWREIKRVANRKWPPATRVAVIGLLAAAIAVTPATMFAAALDFEEAKVCYLPGQPPEEGLLIGEGGGRVLLESNLDKEESVVSLPADETTKIEYGDVLSTLSCPPPAAPVREDGEGEVALDEGTEAELALGLRPQLLFDSGERWRPLEVGSFLGEQFADGRGHGACATGGEPPCPAVEGLDALRRRRGAPAYLDIHGEGRNGVDFESPDASCHEPPPAADCNDGPGSVVYYRRSAREGRWYWDYWWFLRYNDYNGKLNVCWRICGDHEGDWEGITVVTTASSEPRIVGAIYASHKDRVMVDATLLRFAGGRPIAFVAKGTHAAYPFTCRRHCRQYSTIGRVPLPEESHDGAVAWGGNSDGACEAVDCVRPLPEAEVPVATALPRAGAWAAWPGRWGETCHNTCRGLRSYESSPRSPAVQLRFECPWVATRRGEVDGDDVPSKSKPTSDAERLRAACAAERAGL